MQRLGLYLLFPDCVPIDVPGFQLQISIALRRLTLPLLLRVLQFTVSSFQT